MSYAAGTQLGPYQIVERIGAGGMGEVYKATDQRLGRDVAIKVSEERFSVRFAREARAVAALNHRNICQLYDVGPNFLVMELIEGPTLAERIKQAPVPLEEVLAIARQIADALDEAHGKNIVHRDLKPGNIKIKPDGTVKVLDFGLAKVGGTPVANSESAATVSMGETEVGMILGTPSYMAPEQARGKPVDKRADIWAFGVVLYEMFTGAKLFAGDSISETLAEVLKTEPDWEKIPARAQRLVRQCLEKDPAKRLRDIGDAWALLDVGQVHDLSPGEAKRPATGRSHRAAWAAVGVLLLALAALAAVHFREKQPEPPLVRSSVLPPEEGSAMVLDANSGGSAISPDGRQLAFVADAKGKAMLFVRPLDSLEARLLPGTVDASRPFWSPDSRNIGFFAGGKLQRIGVAEGAPRVICDQGVARGATWNRDGVILLSLARPGVLARVSASGGTPEPITTLDQAAGEAFHYWPQFLPDGKHFLYVARNLQADKGVVYAGSLDGPAQRVRLVDSAYGAVYADNPASPRTGYLLFLQGTSLMAQTFDPSVLKLLGEPSPVAQGVGGTASNGYMDVSASRTGVLAYGTSKQGLRRLVWVDRGGKPSEEVSGPGLYNQIRISPDGASALTDSIGPVRDVLRIDLERSNGATRLTFTGDGRSPIWSPDGREIAYVTLTKGVFRKSASGAGEAVALLPTNSVLNLDDWSSDGKFLLYEVTAANSSESGLWALPMEPGGTAGKPVPYVKGITDLAGAQFSPGTGQRFVAYTTRESASGTLQVYVQDFPDAHSKWQISTDGGARPVWSRDGKQLFYLSASGNKLMSASVKIAGSSFTNGKPAPLFEVAALQNLVPFDVSPDGKRFLFVTSDEQNRRLNPITLVQNWQTGLK